MHSDDDATLFCAFHSNVHLFAHFFSLSHVFFPPDVQIESAVSSSQWQCEKGKVLDWANESTAKVSAKEKKQF